MENRFRHALRRLITSNLVDKAPHMYRQQADIAAFFGAATANYEQDIIPAFTQFAQGVVQTATPKGNELTLDVGTGTGILARLIAPHVRQVVGVDLAVPMVQAAAILPENAGIGFATADGHELPFAAQTFDLCVASFGLNATDPRRIFKSIRRVLKPDGALVFHEWSLMHPLDSQMIDVMVKYMLDDDEVPPETLKIRDFLSQPRLWDNILMEADDYDEKLREAGFADIQITEDSSIACVLPVNEFLRYKLSWPGRQAELVAMDASLRGDCLDALRATVQDAADADGNIYYAPQLFRIYAH